jgi:AcrR family transcriptional regulator
MRNKEKTKRKLLDAVGDIIRAEGFSRLGVNKVAKSAAVSKVLIYRYFGNFNQLLCAYIVERRFWKNCMSDVAESAAIQVSMREQVCKVLTEQFADFYNHCEMEAILVNEISNQNVLVKNIVREEATTDKRTYFSVVSTLLLAGTDHLILAEQERRDTRHSDIASLRKTNLLQSIEQIVEWTLG